MWFRCPSTRNILAWDDGSRPLTPPKVREALCRNFGIPKRCDRMGRTFNILDVCVVNNDNMYIILKLYEIVKLLIERF